MSEWVLDARGIVRRYASGDTTIEVLSGASLRVAAGEKVAIVGASGSGKSTFLNVIGLLDRPDAGAVTILGTDALAASETRRATLRRASIGFVFQLYHLVRELTAIENVELAGRVGGVGRRERRRRAAELIERVGLQARRHHRPPKLSGGERQRVAIARALFQRPRLMLCDEPTGNLDRHTGQGVWQLIEETVREHEQALVLVTHEPDLAARCDRIVEVADGRLEPQPRAAVSDAPLP